MEFQEAISKVHDLKEKPSLSVLKQLYGLYKQATVGPNTTPKPSRLNFEARSKWDAWTDVSHLHQEVAKTKYVEIVENLLKKH